VPLALYLVAGAEAERIAHVARSTTGRSELAAAGTLLGDTQAVAAVRAYVAALLRARWLAVQVLAAGIGEGRRVDGRMAGRLGTPSPIDSASRAA